jgi:hypothetical protein
MFACMSLGGPPLCLVAGGSAFNYEPLGAGDKALAPPLPGVAVFSFGGGNAPWVIAVDRHDIVGFTFAFATGLSVSFRVHDETHRFAAPPTILPDGQTLAGTADGAIVFTGPSIKQPAPVTELGPVFAAPTRLPDGRVMVIQADGRVAVLKGGALISNGQFSAGASIASAAASRTHVFISLADAFYTLDAATLSGAAKFDWVGGGASPPAIGPQGHVYAIASNILFVFPPPKRGLGAQTVGGVTGVSPGVATTTQPAATTPAPQSPKRFDDPTVASGLRLYACTAIGGEACGAPVAAAFCQGQGFLKAGKSKTDNKKVKAETLGGEVCSKKRCKVFEFIECRN